MQGFRQLLAGVVGQCRVAKLFEDLGGIVCLRELRKCVHQNVEAFASANVGVAISFYDARAFGEFESESFGKPQPLRTDLERMLKPDKGFLDVEIDA